MHVLYDVYMYIMMLLSDMIMYIRKHCMYDICIRSVIAAHMYITLATDVDRGTKYF